MNPEAANNLSTAAIAICITLLIVLIVVYRIHRDTHPRPTPEQHKPTNDEQILGVIVRAALQGEMETRGKQGDKYVCKHRTASGRTFFIDAPEYRPIDPARHFGNN